MQKAEYDQLKESLGGGVKLVAVSKLQSPESIRQLYDLGHRDFAENYVQELIAKQMMLPHDIRWHFIGHLQSNKIKYIAPFVHLVQSVDSFKLLMEIDRQGKKINRVIPCLLQVKIATEESKFGLRSNELDMLVNGILRANEIHELDHVKISGLMGMGSFSEDVEEVRAEFKYLATLYDKYAHIKTPRFHLQHLSMGMSADYRIAIEEGSNMVRLGSLLFGERPKI